jgi:hypothetical protein
MFIDEARISALLRHSNIVAVEDFGEAEGSLFLVMEWVHGVDAAALLRRVKAQGALLPIDVAAWVVAELLDGLAYAHGKTDDAGRWLQIVHRDVSPHNVMVSFQGDVKLSDFGIAKATSRLHATQGDQVKGKLQYMAPEQAMGTGLDHRADLFAVGVTLFELLTGRLPFVGATPMDGLGAMLAGQRETVRALRPEVSAPMEGVVDRLLAYGPEQRIANAQEAREALAWCADLGAGEAGLKGLLQATFAGEAFSTVVPRVERPAPMQPSADEGATTVHRPARPGELAATMPALPPTAPQRPRVAELTPGPIAVVKVDEARTAAASPRAKGIVISPAAAGVLGVGFVLGAGVLGVTLRATPEAAAPAVLAATQPRTAVVAEARPAAPVAAVQPPVVAAPVAAPTPTAAVAPVVAAPAPGTVSVTVIPWGEVQVDGVRRGENRATLRLTPGTHTIRGIQPGINTRTRTVRVAAGSSQQVRINMIE